MLIQPDADGPVSMSKAEGHRNYAFGVSHLAGRPEYLHWLRWTDAPLIGFMLPETPDLGVRPCPLQGARS